MVELTWQGKYDADGKRTAPLRIQLPLPDRRDGERKRPTAPDGPRPVQRGASRCV